MSTDTKTDGLEYGNVEGLTPKVVEGANPGSTYTVILRSAKGYVGVRRISEDAYRVRCERFDKKVLIENIPEQLKLMLMSAGLRPSGSKGERISGVTVGVLSMTRATAVLGMLLLQQELDLKALPLEQEEKADQMEKHIKSCLNCAKAHLLTPTEAPPGEVLVTGNPGAHDPDEMKN